MQTHLPTPHILKELGARLAQHRLNKNLTQEELARQAGIGTATLKRLEHGSAATQLVNLINVLSVLGLDQNLDLLVPEVPPSPVQQASIQSKSSRKRARKKQPPVINADNSTWTWSDDHNS